MLTLPFHSCEALIAWPPQAGRHRPTARAPRQWWRRRLPTRAGAV